MGKSYRPYLPEQGFLLPPSLREWLPENHLVYFVSDVVDHLNLSALDAAYGDEQRGQPPYDPRMMTKVLVYGYCVGVFSSRRIERRLQMTRQRPHFFEQIVESTRIIFGLRLADAASRCLEAFLRKYSRPNQSNLDLRLCAVSKGKVF